MKTKNSKTGKASRFNLIMVVFAMMALSFTACQNDSGSSVATPPIYVDPGLVGVNGCSGCPGNMGFLVSAVARSHEPFAGQVEIEMGLDFFGDMNMINQLRGANPAFYALPTTGYAGQVAVGGMMHVLRQPISCPVLPPGQYIVQNMNMGFWGNDGAGRSFEGITMTLNGPVQVTAAISGYTMPATPPATDINGMKTYPYRFTATGFRIYTPQGTCFMDYLLQ